MTVEEYQVAQLYSVAEASKNETGNFKTIAENWDSRAPSVGTIFVYLETTA